MEDNEDIARYIGNIIKDSFSVVYARNGREGLLKAKEYVPDIIITDIMMPECDGLEMTRAIRQSTLLNHIPVIIVTAKSDETNKLEGLNCGADAYLIKPFNPDELKLRICKLVAYRSMLRGKYSQLLMDGRDISKEPDAPEQEKNFLAELNRCISSHISHLAFQSELRNDCKNDVPEQIPTQPESEVADRHEYLGLHQAIEAGPCPDVPEGPGKDNRRHRHDVRFRIGQLLHQDVQREIRHHSVGI